MLVVKKNTSIHGKDHGFVGTWEKGQLYRSKRHINKGGIPLKIQVRVLALPPFYKLLCNFLVRVFCYDDLPTLRSQK